MTVESLYNTNNDFKRYVDGYCYKYTEGRTITLHEVFSHEIVKLVAEQYQRKEAAHGNDSK